MGEPSPLFSAGEENFVSRLIDKLFDYLSFYDAFSYVVGVSAFALYRPAKQTERFCDLLANVAPEESSKKLPGKDIANIEVRSKEEAKQVVKEALKEEERQGIRGHLFIRLMAYNVKTQVVSSLHLVDTVCHPSVSAGMVTDSP